VSYSVLLHPRVARQIEKMNSDLRSRIKSALLELKNSPESRGERLQPSDYWRVRVGDYRAIYRIDKPNKTVLVIFVGHRSKVYDDFERLF
jgi:mRNA interferase RelE/StbE